MVELLQQIVEADKGAQKVKTIDSLDRSHYKDP
jgi:hypothetical protein